MSIERRRSIRKLLDEMSRYGAMVIERRKRDKSSKQYGWIVSYRDMPEGVYANSLHDALTALSQHLLFLKNKKGG